MKIKPECPYVPRLPEHLLDGDTLDGLPPLDELQGGPDG